MPGPHVCNQPAHVEQSFKTVSAWLETSGQPFIGLVNNAGISAGLPGTAVDLYNTHLADAVASGAVSLDENATALRSQCVRGRCYATSVLPTSSQVQRPPCEHWKVLLLL